MNANLVSVVINNYNYGRYLLDCIDSVREQTDPNWELIIVDDGSTDESSSILGSLDYINCKIIRKVNGGQGSCYNIGFASSSGDVVVFLDADDRLEKSAVARIREIELRGISKIQGVMKLIDEYGESGSSLIPQNYTTDAQIIKDIENFFLYVTPPGSGNFYTRSYLEQVLPIAETRWRISADLPLIALAPIYGRVLNLTFIVAFYRVHRANATGVRGSGSEEELLNYAKLEISKDIDRRHLLNEKLRSKVWIRKRLLPNPSYLKLRLVQIRLRRDISVKRRYLMLWITVKAGFGILPFLSFYTYRKRFIFTVWIVLAAVLPRELAARLFSYTVYPFGRFTDRRYALR